MIPLPQLTCDECGATTTVTVDEAQAAPMASSYRSMTKRHGFTTVDLCRSCKSALRRRQQDRRKLAR